MLEKNVNSQERNQVNQQELSLTDSVIVTSILQHKGGWWVLLCRKILLFLVMKLALFLLILSVLLQAGKYEIIVCPF